MPSSITAPLFNFIMSNSKVKSLASAVLSYEQVKQVRYLQTSKMQFVQQAKELEALALKMRKSAMDADEEIEGILQILVKKTEVTDIVGAVISILFHIRPMAHLPT
jgi:uncharacterized protein YlxW (UPF0749 family)